MKAYSKTVLPTSYPESTHAIKHMIKAMKVFRAEGALTTNHWSLDAPSHFDWKKNTEIKNADRDLRKWAAAAYIEELTVKSYRKSLLLKCKPASFIRKALAETLSPFINRKRIIVPGSSRTEVVAEYTFADKLKVAADADNADFDMAEVMSSREEVAYINAARSAVSTLHTKITNSEYVRRTPGSQNIAPDILEHLERLERVRTAP